MATGLARRTAWETYTSVANELLPLLEANVDADPGAVGARLDAVRAQIRRYALLWSDQGDMLRAAVESAARLHRGDDRAGLVAVLRLVSARLFLLSVSTRPTRTARHRNERGFTV